MSLEPGRVLISAEVEEIEDEGFDLLLVYRLETPTQQVDEALPATSKPNKHS